MKRGMPRSGRGYGNQAQQRMARPIDSGPLMTEHLHNLDLELELLKRKREMLEQQQQIIQEKRSSRQRPYDFDQPRYFEQAHYDPPETSLNRNFSHLYDPTESHNFIPLSSDRKRPSEYPWMEDLPPKRFSGPSPSRGNMKSFGSRLGAMSPASRAEPQQSSSSFQRGRVEINTNRRALPKQEPRPLMALSTRPPRRRPPLNPRLPQQPIRRDFKPTKVTKPKSVAKNPPNQLDTRSVPERKELVAQASHLVKKVDESMRLRADKEPSVQLTGRLELALGQILKDLKLKYGERQSHAHIFQQQNLQRLMKQMIRERIRNVMLGKVVGPFTEVLDAYRVVYPIETDEDIVKVALEAQPGSAHKKFDIKLVETENPEKYFKVNTEKLLQVKLREMFNKLIEISKNPLTKDDLEASKDKGDKKYILGKNDNKEEDFTKDLTEEDINVGGQIGSDDKLEDYRFSLDKLDDMIEWRLPRILKKFIPLILKVMNTDHMYEATKAFLVMKTNAKAMALAKKAEKMELSGQRTPVVSKPQSEETEQQLIQSQTGGQTYYVKIFGRPVLPKRKVMQGFLNQFQPKSIKKHKAVQNLLYVAFMDKDNFDDILAEDGVVIGKSTIEIKVSEQRPNQKQSTQATNDDDVQIIENVDKPINLDDTLNSELDEQITDLLTSIRQAENEQENDTEGNVNVAMEEIDDEDKNDTMIELNAESELQTQSHETKVVEKSDEDNNKVNEGQKESDETQKDLETADEESNIVSGAQNKPNEMQKNDEKADEVSKIACESDNEPNEIQKDVERTDEINNTVGNGEKNITETFQSETNDQNELQSETNDQNELQSETNDQKELQSDTNDKKELQSETNDQKESQDSAEKLGVNINEELEKRDVVASLKSDKDSGRSTPTRTSARLANITPSTIRTRRASRLEQQN